MTHRGQNDPSKRIWPGQSNIISANWCNMMKAIWRDQSDTIHIKWYDGTTIQYELNDRIYAKQYITGQIRWCGWNGAHLTNNPLSYGQKDVGCGVAAWENASHVEILSSMLKPCGSFGLLYTGGNRNVGIFRRTWRRVICNSNCVACETGRPEAREPTYTAWTIIQLGYTVFIIRITHTPGKTRDQSEGKNTTEQTRLSCSRIPVLSLRKEKILTGLISPNQAKFVGCTNTWEQRARFIHYLAEIVIIKYLAGQNIEHIYTVPSIVKLWAHLIGTCKLIAQRILIFL